MPEKLCKTEEEIQLIIVELQNETPDLEEALIRRAISSCCVKTEIVKNHETFIGCVKERIKMFKLM